MKISAFVLLLLTTLLSIGSHAENIQFGNYQYSVNAPASWVEPLTPTVNAKRSNNADESTIVILSDQQTRFTPQKATEAYSHLAIVFNNNQALSDFNSFSIPFDPGYQQLQIHHLKRHRDGKEQSVLSNTSIKIIHREQQREVGLYQGQVDAYFVVEDLRAGDTLDFAYTIVGENPLFAEHRLAYFPMQWQLRIDLLRVRIVDDFERPLLHKIINGQLSPSITQQGKSRIYIWQHKNVAPYTTEEDAPSWYNPAMRLQITDFESWQQVAEWANSLFVVPQQLPKELSSQLAQWKKQSKNQKELVSHILRFVQEEIRYFGIEVAVNAYKPFPPEEVLKRRYGDCKDKALMIVTLLRAAGIEAHPALVNSHATHRMPEFLPSAAAFDHAIATAVVDGKQLWLDGTARYQFGRLERIGFFDYGYALVVATGSKELTAVSNPFPAFNGIDIEQQFTFNDKAGNSQMKVSTRYSGGEAERMRYRLAYSKDQFSKEIVNYYARIYEGVSHQKPLQINDDVVENVITIVEEYQLKTFATVDDKQIQLPLRAAELSPFSEITKQPNRQSPLANYFPFTGVQRQIFLIPEHNPLIAADAELTIDSKGFQYNRTASDDGKKLVVEHRYQSKLATITPDQLSSHIDAQRKLSESLWAEVTMRRKAEQESQQRLQNLIQGLMKNNQ